MSSPIHSFPPPLQGGVNALSAPITPGKRVANVDRSKVDPQIVKAAEGMEQMFLEYMMRVMRQTVPKSEMDLESPATEVYRGMLDTEYAQKAIKTGGVGLSDQIIAYLMTDQYNQRQGQGAQNRSTGGTPDEGQSTRK